MAECKHGVSEDCPACAQETIAALVKALRAFIDHATYPVSTEINPRGYAWRGEETLDYAKGVAEAVLNAVGGSGT